MPEYRFTLHALLLTSNIQHPREINVKPQWVKRNSRYESYNTPWENCYLLHAVHAKPDFLTDDIINKTRSFVVQKGYYQDPLLLLMEVVSAANANLNDNDLEAIVSLMHENGTRWFKARLADGLPSRLTQVDLQEDMLAARRRVRDELKDRGVLEDKAGNVAEAWCSKLETVELQGRVIGHWSTSVCPWLYDTKKDTKKEMAVIDFLNKGGVWVDEIIGQEQGRSITSKLRKRLWIHAGNTSIRPKTGANMTARIGPGFRKPDAVLMDITAPIDRIEWTDVISALEFKHRNTTTLMEQASEYMSEIARLVLTNQINRRYFVGLLLLGADLFVCTYTRGGSSVTFPIDIYREVNKFLNCMTWFKHADLEFLGYDKSIVRHDFGYKMTLKKEDELAYGAVADIVSVIYNSNSAIGRSTRILGLTYQPSSAETDHLIVKDVWQDMRLASDGEIHKLLEDSGRIDKTRKLLGSEFPERISKTPEEFNLTEEMFQSWGIRPGWDDLNAEGMHPWHLPIRDDRFSVKALEMTDGNNGRQAIDSVPVILQNMTTTSDPLIHRRTVFRTPAVKCTWFSCRREFLHGVLDSLLGHLEACRRGIMHRDTSEGNVWFWVPQSSAQYTVPEWYLSPESGKPYLEALEAPAPWFPKRPGMTGDFGLGLNMLDEAGAANAVTTTGTFPFGTTANSGEAPHFTHDLESYIFLIWIVGVNFKGPYYQFEHWPPPPEAKPIPSNSMANDEAADLISSKLQLPVPISWPGKGQPPSSVKRFSATQRAAAKSGDEEFERRNAIVPEWAKMGSLYPRTEFVLHQKKALNYETFDLSLHPYWKVGKLRDGWLKLFNLLWPTQEDPRKINAKRSSLTHAALVGVIREMILLIPPADDGAPSRAVVEDARLRYRSSIKRLVDAGRFTFVPNVSPYSYNSGTSIPPPSHEPSRATAPSSYSFVQGNPGKMRRTSQKRLSDTSTGGLLPQAGTSSCQPAEISVGNAGSRVVSNSSGKRRKV
ncbi:uncharacterized protein BJ212DRAFT_706888 [Suillus subaureus]|uniref:Fungal-type protein kinase domain-containing protein n=1 Tax=Suillus subaureus TaxID=48587 RepID=A0A9P7EKU0_9AGAM|nr:uncharacterized protein BJ212DRAFT_706888 [Suillus subaureus]KAG1823878.1 hypothetical protein BJ212DRAFT_706888 [Suillus subaureus]